MAYEYVGDKRNIEHFKKLEQAKSVLEKIRLHNEFVNREFERAKKGETICLTDLFISKEKVEEAIRESARKFRFSLSLFYLRFRFKRRGGGFR